jgi:Fe-S cluster assembly protein SufD
MIATQPPKTIKESDPYLEQFQRFESEDRRPSWLYPIRKAGIARFAELGFPTLNHEDWRFTNVAPVASLPFKPVFKPGSDSGVEQAIKNSAFAGLPGSKLVFIDGHFFPNISTMPGVPKGTIIASLAKTLAVNDGLLEQQLAQHARTEDNAFAALNTAFFSDGAFIHVPAGCDVEDPVQLIFISTGRETGAAVFPRNLIIAEAGSRLTVVETHLSISNAAVLNSPITELLVGDNATVEHLKFQDESRQSFHLATVHGEFGRASNVSFHSFALGARLSRNNIHVRLAGEGLECILNGLYLTRGEQLADHHMIVEHAQPRCASHEYFNGILDGRSKGVFHGRILVQPVAQKTDAKQTNRNLLLSDEATVDTKPQLEIYADDVKCTHGATVGQMNEDSIFYLRARGIGLEKARQMLMHAFAGEIIDRIKCEPAREILDRIVWNRLEENPRISEGK